MNSKTPTKKPLFPDGSELYIGLVAGGVLGLILLFYGFPIWSYLLAAVFAFFFCIFSIQFWTEDDRQYWRGINVKREIEEILEDVEAGRVLKPEASYHIESGVKNARLIIGELMKQKPTRMYGGMFELAPYVRKLEPVYWEYLDIQDYPSKAGEEYAELMQKAEEAFEGFEEQMRRMLVRVNKGDIFNMTVSAELLRSLRNLLSTSE